MITIKEYQTVQAAMALMGAHRIRHLPVVRAGHLVAIITSRDCHRMAVAETNTPGARQEERSPSPATTQIRECMITRVLTATQGMRIAEAARLMSARKIGCLPVVLPESMEVVGTLTETDTMRILARLLNQQESHAFEKPTQRT